MNKSTVRTEINTAKALFERASVRLRSGNAIRAEAICRSALERFPKDSDIRCLLGIALSRQGKQQEGLKQLRKVVKAHPDYAMGHEQLGNTLFGLGDLDAAVECFERAVQLDPTNASLHVRLGDVFSKLGRNTKAQAAFAEGAKLDPYSKPMADAAGFRLAGRWTEAIAIYQGILRDDPDNVTVMYELAAVLSRTGYVDDAIRLLNSVVELRATFAPAWVDLSIAFQMREQTADATRCALRAVELVPDDPRVLSVLGEAYVQGGEIEQAIATYKKGLAFDPNNVPLLSALGIALRTAGHRDEAIKCFEACIAENPLLGEAYYNLANLKSYRFSDTQIAAMQASLCDDSLRLQSRINFHFALGKALEDGHDYAESFEHYRAGNSLRHKQRPYRPEQVDEAHEGASKVFSHDLAGRVGAERPSGDEVVPIFIVGMPRSGSTLIEQILASHSLVEGTRELPFLGRVVRQLDVDKHGDVGYPEAFGQLSSVALRKLGDQYLAATESQRTGRPYFIDKMPNNFSLVGAIRLMLPQAKVINARRHPLSTCVSTYKQLFFGGQIFSYDLSDLAHYYLRYQQLMTHWHEVFPGFVLDVQYENLVDDQEAETRRLLDFCGLAFEESCMTYYATARAVATASSEQVRQPIYRTSLDIWRPYESYIGELIEGLKPILVGLPEDQQPRSLLVSRA